MWNQNIGGTLRNKLSRIIDIEANADTQDLYESILETIPLITMTIVI